jgi:hypothetical protein
MENAMATEKKFARRFKASADWRQKRLDWNLVESVASHVCRTVAVEGHEQVVTLVVSDQHSELDINDLREARERIEQEGSGLQSLELSVCVGSLNRARKATFRLRYAHDSIFKCGRWCGWVEWDYPNENDVRAAKAEFVLWIRGKIKQRARSAKTESTSGKGKWWRPSFRHVRDHLVADLIWLGILVGAGFVTAIVHHHF